MVASRRPGIDDLRRVRSHRPAHCGKVGDTASLKTDDRRSRRHFPTDGRRTQVRLTASGREELLGHLVPMFIGLAEVDGSLSDDERVVVQRYLDGAIRAVKRILGPDHP